VEELVDDGVYYSVGQEAREKEREGRREGGREGGREGTFTRRRMGKSSSTMASTTA